MTETDPTWKNWERMKPDEGLFYQDYKKQSEILGELLARSDAEVERLRSRVTELEDEKSRLVTRVRQAKDDKTFCEVDLLNLQRKNARLRAALEPFARGTIISRGDGFAMLIDEDDVEKARAALGGESSDLVLVPRKVLEPFVRIAAGLEACQSSRKSPDSAPLSPPIENIPAEDTYVSLGMVRELARIARGNRPETPDSLGE